MNVLKKIIESDVDVFHIVLHELMKLLKLKVYVLAGGMLFDSLYGFCC
jgi:hypothetical protein